MEKYFGFKDRNNVACEFEEGTWEPDGDRYAHDSTFTAAPDFPTDEEIIFAAYTSGGYEGSALVLFERDGKLFEVSGSHCSCYGLEGQWTPDETSWKALGMRKLESWDFDGDKEIQEAFRNVIAEHQ